MQAEAQEAQNDPTNLVQVEHGHKVSADGDDSGGEALAAIDGEDLLADIDDGDLFAAVDEGEDDEAAEAANAAARKFFKVSIQ